MISKAGYQIVNIDLTYVGEEPRLEKFKKNIEENLAKEMNISPKDISIYPCNKTNIKVTKKEDLETVEQYLKLAGRI